MKSCLKFLSSSLLALFASAAFAQTGTPAFAVLGTTAITCVAPGAITGDVGVSPAGAYAPGACVIDGTAHVNDPAAAAARTAFLNAYAKLQLTPCTRTFVRDTPTGGNAFTGQALSLQPGVYCFEAAATFTDTTLTLDGPSTGIWIFKIGTAEPGALTGTRFTVLGGDKCNVTWWVDAAASMSNSNVVGSILAGTAVTLTEGGTLKGNAWAKTAVSIEGTVVTGCDAPSAVSDGVLVCKVKKHHKHKKGHGHDGDDHDHDDDDDDDDDDKDDRGGKNGKKQGKRSHK